MPHPANHCSQGDLQRMVAAVPDAAAAALSEGYLFRPPDREPGDETVIADRYDVALSDNAGVSHRTLIPETRARLISTRLRMTSSGRV